MAIKITIKEPETEDLQQNTPDNTQPELAQQPPEQPVDKEPLEPLMKVSLNIRKGLDDRLVIHDHDHIDIVFLPTSKKVVCFSKQDYSDLVYDTQNRLFNFLIKKGIISPESIRASNVYGAFEGKVQENKSKLPLEHIIVLNISKWLELEKPAMDMDREYAKRMTEPQDDETTELGEVPQEEKKGSLPTHGKRYVGGWW